MTTKSLLHSSLLDNQYYTSMLVGNAGYEPSDEDILAEEVLASTQGSVTFSGLDTLAAGYKQLQIRGTARSTRNDTDSYYYVQFNGDSGTNYNHHYLQGTGSQAEAARADGGRPYGVLDLTGLPGNTAPASSFGAFVIDIVDPFEATKLTTVRIYSGQTAAYSRIGFIGGQWENTAAVTSITLADIFGSFMIGSHFTLIGLK